MSKLKILVVDDEQPARRKLCNFIKAQDDNVLIEEASNGIEACDKINSFNPSLVFLDIQMPQMSGIEVIQNLNPDELPLIIFVTAFDQYAIKAFEINAIDYLLKPFDEERFRISYERAMERMNKGNKEELLSLLSGIKKEKKHMERMLVSFKGKYFFVPTDEIIYFTADKKYVELHTENAGYLVRETISGLQTKLDPDKFARIHRSYIVNVSQIHEMQPWSHGDYIVILRNGTKLNMSRRYKTNLFKDTSE